MADVVSEISTLSIKLTMYRDSDESTKTRTFSVRDPAVSEEESDTFRQSLQALQNFLLGDGKTLIQPTGWRDEDTTEDEYITTAVEFTTEEGVGTKWDTRLTHNMQMTLDDPSSTQTPQTISSVAASSIGTSTGDPLYVYFIGNEINYDDIKVSFNNTGLSTPPMVALQEGSDNNAFAWLVKMDGPDIAGSEVVFELPAEGVYQSDSVTLTIGT